MSAPDYARYSPEDSSCVHGGVHRCENSRVQFARRKFFSIWSICKPKLLTTAIRGGQKRNRFYALLAHARFHAAWTLSRHSVCPATATSVAGPRRRGE